MNEVPSQQRITGRELKLFLTGSLGRLRVAVPTDDECSDFAQYLSGPNRNSGGSSTAVSTRPYEKMVAFLNALTEIEEFHKEIRNFVVNNVNNAPPEFQNEALRFHDKLYTDKIRAVREALANAEHLIHPPRPPIQHWHEAAANASMIFRWIMNRSGSNVHAGLSEHGPLTEFVGKVIKRSGWTVSNAAISQQLRRDRTRSKLAPTTETY